MSEPFVLDASFSAFRAESFANEATGRLVQNAVTGTGADTISLDRTLARVIVTASRDADEKVCSIMDHPPRTADGVYRHCCQVRSDALLGRCPTLNRLATLVR